MKINIDSDEAYPVYGASKLNEYDKHFVEITDGEWAWIQRVEEEYQDLQEFLRRKQEEQWNNPVKK